MSPLRSVPNVAANTGLPNIFAYGETAGGLALQLRSDPAGVLDVPELQSVLVVIPRGRSSKNFLPPMWGEAHRLRGAW